MYLDSPFARFWVPHLPAYRDAAGWAAQFEMAVRMTADALPVSGGTSKDLDDLFDRVVGKLKPFLQAEQLASLTTVGLCQLRHDLLHCRFSKAYGKLGGKEQSVRRQRFQESGTGRAFSRPSTAA